MNDTLRWLFATEAEQRTGADPLVTLHLLGTATSCECEQTRANAADLLRRTTLPEDDDEGSR